MQSFDIINLLVYVHFLKTHWTVQVEKFSRFCNVSFVHKVSCISKVSVSAENFLINLFVASGWLDFHNPKHYKIS